MMRLAIILIVLLLIPRGKGEKHPGRGVKQHLKPRAHKQSEQPSWL